MRMKEALESFDKEKKMSEKLNFKVKDVLWPLWRKGQDKFVHWAGGWITGKAKNLLFCNRNKDQLQPQEWSFSEFWEKEELEIT